MKAASNPIRITSALFISGLFAAAAFGGPGPQYWNRPAPKPAAKSDMPKVEASAATKCGGCTNTPIWASNDRGPAGKGAPAERVVGTQHSCTLCSGTVAKQGSGVKDTMTLNKGCGPLACCK